MSLKKSDKIRLNKFALQLREEQGIKLMEPISIHQMLRNKEIITSFQPLSKGFEGMAVKLNRTDSEKRFMLINTSSIYSRQRFTACHELYHLLFQENFTVSYDTEGDSEHKSLEEQSADYFARCLLLPFNGIWALVPEAEYKKDTITLATILKLEHTFRCSRSCLLLRLREMELISCSVFDAYSRNIIRGAAEYGYPVSLYQPTNRKELVGDYNVKARQLYDKGLISQAKYFSLLFDMGIELGKGEDDGKSCNKFIHDALIINQARFPVDKIEAYKPKINLGEF